MKSLHSHGFVIWIISLLLSFIYGLSNPIYKSDNTRNYPSKSDLKESTESLIFNSNKIPPTSFDIGFNPDRQRGLEALANTRDEVLFEFYLKQLISGLTPADFGRFLDEVNMLFPHGPNRVIVFTETFYSWISQDYTAALEAVHVYEQSEPNLWLAIMKKIAPVWIETDSQGAMQWYFAKMKNVFSNSMFKDNHLLFVDYTNSFINTDFNLFLNAILTNKATLNYNFQSSLLTLASNADYNTLTDIAPLLTLYEELAASDKYARIDAVESITEKLMALDLSAAIEWTQTIEDEDAQLTALDILVGEMGVKDPFATYSWLNQMELSANEHSQLTGSIIKGFEHAGNYADFKAFYIQYHAQPEVSKYKDWIANIITINKLPPTNAVDEIRFWLTALPNEFDSTRFARTIKNQLKEHPFAPQIESLIQPYLNEDKYTDRDLETEADYIVLPPW